MYLARNYKILIIVFFLFRITNGIAQDTINLTSVEQRSYKLYQDKNWSELIKYGNMAVKKGYDYFYLQLRIGIAFYEKKNYCLAETHFKKALKFNSNDELAQEYLYYCYVYMGRSEEARVLSKQFGKKLSEKTGTDMLPPVGLFMVEAGTKKTDSASYYDSHRKTNSNYFNSAIYFQIGLKHYVKDRFSLFHAVTYFSQQNFVTDVRQFQYYLNASIPLKNNWSISPAFHFINIKNTSETKPPPPNPMQMGPPPMPITNSTNSNYFVGSLSIQKNIKRVVLSLGTTVSNMNNKTQYIHSGLISYSILGNSRLIVGCTEYLHTINSYSTINTSVSPFIFMQPINHVSITASYLVNNGNNIIENNGYLVNNSPDLTKSRWSVLASFDISKHITLYGLYQLEYKQEEVQLFNYRYNVFVGGIKITP